MSKAAGLCIVPGCKNKRHCRGVCVSCYFEARRRIAAGATTDETLVRKKLLLAVNRSGRPSKNKMAKLIGAR